MARRSHVYSDGRPRSNLGKPALSLGERVSRSGVVISQSGTGEGLVARLTTAGCAQELTKQPLTWLATLATLSPGEGQCSGRTPVAKIDQQSGGLRPGRAGHFSLENTISFV